MVKLDHCDFVGRDALRQIKADGWNRKLVGFEMTDRNIARHGYAIVSVDTPTEQIGVVTSGCPSPTLGKNIGLGYVPKRLAKVGTPLAIDIRGKRTAGAVVVKTPFYKRSA